MPKLRRRFGGRKKQELERPDLEEVCLLGCTLEDGPEAVDRPDYPEREADWRTRLTMPDGFYMFIEWLLQRRGPISEREGQTVDRACLALSPSLIAFAGMENPAVIDGLSLSSTRLRNTAKYFSVAARWHERRGRATLAELYRRRARACVAAIEITT